MRSLFCLLACLALACNVALGGVVLVVENKVLGDEPHVGRSKVSIDGRKLRMDLMESGATKSTATAIFRADKQKMWNIDHATRSYIEMTKDQVDAMAVQIGGAMKKMQEQMAQMPPEQRAMMAEMMGGMTAAAQETKPGKVSKTGEKKEINGYPCVKYEIHRGGEKTADVWATPWKKAGIKKETFDVFKDMAEFYSAMMDALRQGNAGMEWDTFAQFEEIDAYPVMIKDYDGGQVRSITTFKSAEKKALGPDTFEIPSGYNRQTMPMGAHGL